MYGTDGQLWRRIVAALGVATLKIDTQQVMPVHIVAVLGDLHGVAIVAADVVKFMTEHLSFEFYDDQVKAFTVVGGTRLFASEDDAAAVHHGTKNVLALQRAWLFCLCCCSVPKKNIY